MAKKLKIDTIDENFIINSFRQDDFTTPVKEQPPEVQDENKSEEEVTPSAQKKTIAEEPRRRKSKGKEDDYQELFLKEANISARFGKTTYIRKEYHERIQRIVRVIGKDEVSLFSYIDNVLAHHFLSFQDEITDLYNKNNESIF
jgi:hypothetical protein